MKYVKYIPSTSITTLVGEILKYLLYNQIFLIFNKNKKIDFIKIIY
jgi:hypothetical protein